MQDWFQVLAIAGTTVGALWAFRREAKDERREYSNKFDRVSEDIRDLRKDMNGLREDMNKEFRDFHGRMCVLQEQYNQMMQKALDKK